MAIEHSISTDILIIGSGAAGLTLALSLADRYQVTVVSKDQLLSGSSPHAQGGIAAVLTSKPEEIDAHIKDTLNAGAGLCERDSVSYIVNQGKNAINWLIGHGVLFTKHPQNNELHLTREGGHSKRRIIHADDRTGHAISDSLTSKVLQHRNIQVLEHYLALDLITHEQNCLGALIFDQQNNQKFTMFARTTILATGGANSLYQHTTSQSFASGDGIAMAWRAGCTIKNMEFIQFHPTRFYHPDSPPFLITEAMRGEGAKLTLPDSKAFLPQYDPRAELAPRDIVARAMHLELTQHHLSHLILNISHRPANQVRTLFPTINQHCSQYGIDITTDHIPVVPAAHYTCGGIETNTAGQTNINNLYAIGETACTGLHGANRMASNSLLECVVIAMTAAEKIQTTLSANSTIETTNITPTIHPSCTLDSTQAITLTQKLQRGMWQHVGIVRSNQGLAAAQQLLKKLQQKQQSNQDTINRPAIELRNLIDCATLTTTAAINRRTNCGAHYNIDLTKNKTLSS